MNPFAVNKVIKEIRKNKEQITIDELSERCSARIRHRYVKVSKDMFMSSGFPRHWVVGLRPSAWITLWFYSPEKFSKKMDELAQNRVYEEIESIYDEAKSPEK